jgi:hypothetical protein
VLSGVLSGAKTGLFCFRTEMLLACGLTETLIRNAQVVLPA